MNKTKLLSLLLCALILLGACAPAEQGETPPLPDTPDTPEAPDVPDQPTADEEKIFRWIAESEDTGLNPHDATTAGNYTVVDLIQSALYGYTVSADGTRAELRPVLASGMPESEDGLSWTITLNPDAKWQNGESITADDFIYSWQMALDPILSYGGGSSVAYRYISVDGAYDYYAQSPEAPVEWDSVGMTALDASTLVITTDMPYTQAEVARHFTQRATSPVYRSLYESGMSADGTSTTYGTELSMLMTCGPFTLTEWVKGAQRTFEKNELYIYADEISLDGIDSRVVLDEATRMQIFEQGESDYVLLGASGIAKYAEDPRLDTYDQKTVRTLEVNRSNPEKEILNDVNFRRALYLAIDRDGVAKLTNTVAAPYFLSTVGEIYSDGTTYRSLPEAQEILPSDNGFSPDEAVALFEDAMLRYGMDSIELDIVYSESHDNLRVASEFIAAQWEEIFDGRITVTLRSMQHSAVLDLMRTSQEGQTAEWDLAWSGWALAAETYYPNAKFDPYQSTSSRRYTNYSNGFLDENYPLFATDEYRFDQQATAQLTVDIEASILSDATCIPVYQERGYVMFSERTVLPAEGYLNSIGFAWYLSDFE